MSQKVLNEENASWLKSRHKQMQEQVLFGRTGNGQKQKLTKDFLPANATILSEDMFLANADAQVDGFAPLQDRKLEINK